MFLVMSGEQFLGYTDRGLGWVSEPDQAVPFRNGSVAIDYARDHSKAEDRPCRVVANYGTPKAEIVWGTVPGVSP